MKQSSQFQTSLLIILYLNLYGPLQFVQAVGTIGDKCQKHTECDQSKLIQCNKFTGRCDCLQLQPPLQFHNGKCVSFVGGPCNLVTTLGLQPVNCIDDSVCVKKQRYDPTDIFGVCACRQGYFRTINHQCAKDSPTSNTLEGGLEVPKSSKGRSDYYNQNHASSARYAPTMTGGSTSSSIYNLSIFNLWFLILGLILR